MSLRAQRGNLVAIQSKQKVVPVLLPSTRRGCRARSSLAMTYCL